MLWIYKHSSKSKSNFTIQLQYFHIAAFIIIPEIKAFPVKYLILFWNMAE